MCVGCLSIAERELLTQILAFNLNEERRFVPEDV
jgi:hypothetical protein